MSPEAVLVAVALGMVVAFLADDLRGALARDVGAVLTLAVVAAGFWAQTHGHPFVSACLLAPGGALGVVFRVPAWIFEEGR